jgi:hypothetical protein
MSLFLRRTSGGLRELCFGCCMRPFGWSRGDVARSGCDRSCVDSGRAIGCCTVGARLGSRWLFDAGWLGCAILFSGCATGVLAAGSTATRLTGGL